MRVFVCTCVVLFVLVTMATGSPLNSGVSEPKPHYDLADAPALFEKFIKDYNKNYIDAKDKEDHYNAFVSSLETINRLNSDPKQGSATFDINHLADYTREERKQMQGLRNV